MRLIVIGIFTDEKNYMSLLRFLWTGFSVNRRQGRQETKGKSRVFYTSLGHPDDFKSDAFQTLLVNGILWALKKKANQES